MSDPAMFKSEFERKELDFYPTPEWLTEIILPDLVRNKFKNVWEPACGNGAMAEVIKKAGFEVYSSDLSDYGYGIGGRDFFLEQALPFTDRCAIVTNPPYGDLAEKFIRHSINLVRPVYGAVYMLLRHEYDTASSRLDLFTDANLHFKKKITITPRPRWIPGSTGAPRHSYAWFVWDTAYFGLPKLEYYHLEDKTKNVAYGE